MIFKHFSIVTLLICFLNVSNAQTSSTSSENPSLKQVRNEFVPLYQENDSALSFQIQIEKVELVGKKSLNFLGSYKDWKDNQGYVWLRFQNSIEEEFQTYFNKVLSNNENNIKLSLTINQFRLKQYLVANGQGCFYRYNYELYYYQNDKRYSLNLKNKIKIEKVKGPKELLDEIKNSIWELLSKGASIDNFQAD